jgi:SAM-dependent methyltransferase
MSTTTIDKSASRIRGMFGAIAPTYDLLNHLLSCNVDRYWRWKTTQLVPPDAGIPVLDVCTGTGDLALAYWRRGRGQVPVIGADFCGDMLALARRKAARLGARNVAFVQADAQRLPFADNYFQIVSVAFGLRNISDYQQGLAEMVRVGAARWPDCYSRILTPQSIPGRTAIPLVFSAFAPVYRTATVGHPGVLLPASQRAGVSRRRGVGQRFEADGPGKRLVSAVRFPHCHAVCG